MIGDDLKDLYQQGRLIPFIGAGVSMSVEWMEGGKVRRGPSWSEMVDQAANQLGFKDANLLRVRGTDLQILEYYKLKHHNQVANLTNWLYASMRPSDDDLRKSLIHSRLVEMSKCGLFYTTNYDDFIERCFQIHGRPCKSIAVEAHMGDTSPSCEIVKFHGDWGFPNEMVLTESDYERRLNLSTAMDYRLRSDILGRALLFIGYSFRDWNISYLFRLVNDQFKSLPSSPYGRRAYIIFADPSDFEIALFRARNIEVISINRSDITSEIANVLEAIRS